MNEYPRRIDSPLIGKEVCVGFQFGVLTGVQVTLESGQDVEAPFEQIWAHLIDGCKSYAVAIVSLASIKPV